MKNKTIKAALIGGGCTVLAAFIANGVSNNQTNTIKVEDNSGTIINGDGNSYVEGDVNYDNSIKTTYSISVDNSSSIQQLKAAQKACINGDYDIAYDIYAERNETIAKLNLGYIYANGLSYVGEDIEKAEKCFKEADCIEAKRNLFILYIESDRGEDAKNLLINLLWNIDDNVTWDYIANCLYGQSWDEYQNENNIDKSQFSFDFSLLYEWEDTNGEYRGYNPPSGTMQTRWVCRGVDFAVGEGVNHPYIIYGSQTRKYAKEISIMSSMYYENEGMLYAIE